MSNPSGASSFLFRVFRSDWSFLGDISGDQIPQFEYVLVENDIGALVLTLPPTVPAIWFLTDTIIEIYRTISGVTTLEGSTVWFVRDVATVLEQSGHRYIHVTAFDARFILDGRIVDAVAGSAAAAKSQAGDDMIRQIVREQAGSLSVADGFGTRNYLSVEANRTQFGVISRAFSHRNVLNVIKSLAENLLQEDFCAFHVVRSAASTLEFRVQRGGLGVDRRRRSSQPLIFSPDNNTLFDVQVVYTTKDEKTVGKIGGEGEAELRQMTYAGVPSGLARSPWNRREVFVDARNTRLPEQIISEVTAFMLERVARLVFSANVQQTAEVQYGVHYFWGDRVTADALGFTFDCRLSKVAVRGDANGETITINLTAEEFLFT